MAERPAESVGVDKAWPLALELVLLSASNVRDTFSRQDEERGEHLALDDATIEEAIEILLRRNPQSTFVEASL